MYRLENPLQRYAWGSPTAIPELLGFPPDGGPVAEVWFGGHPLAPSMVHSGPDAVMSPLPDLLARSPEQMLGPRVIAAFGHRMPFLLKVLAAAQPLSLQVHPHAAQARAGFDREEAAGLDRAGPERAFRDRQHKPELVLALTRFEALCGFRAPQDVLELLDGLGGSLAAQLRSVLGGHDDPAAVRAAFELLLGLRGHSPEQLAVLVAACQQRLGSPPERSLSEPAPSEPAAGVDVALADRTVVDLARWHPGDPGAVASLMLHRITLAPGDTMYVPAGAVHAYLSGTAVEVMASSDNVLRAGLTSKHVDIPALLACTDYAPTLPGQVCAEVHDDATTVLRAPAIEFALAHTRFAPGSDGADSGAATSMLPGDGPRVVLCLDGHVGVRPGDGRPAVRLDRGQSVFVPHDAGPLELTGQGRAVTAFVP